MGFLDMFSGGGGIDTGFAESMAIKSINDANDANRLLALQNLPYMNLGEESASMLGFLLGLPGHKSPLGKPKTEKEIYDDLFLSQDFVVKPQGGQQNIWGETVGQYTDFNALDAEVQRLLAEQESAAANADQEQYGSLLDPFTMEDYQQSPNYQFNLEEGQKAIDRAAAARGDYLSPEAVKELTRYSQNLASNEFLNSYNMHSADKASVYDMLMGGTGSGQNAVAQQSANSANNTAVVTDLHGQLGQLNLASQADKAAKRQSAFANLASIAGMAMRGLGAYNSLAAGSSFGGNMSDYDVVMK